METIVKASELFPEELKQRIMLEYLLSTGLALNYVRFQLGRITL